MRSPESVSNDDLREQLKVARRRRSEGLKRLKVCEEAASNGHDSKITSLADLELDASDVHDLNQETKNQRQRGRVLAARKARKNGVAKLKQTTMRVIESMEDLEGGSDAE